MLGGPPHQLHSVSPTWTFFPETQPSQYNLQLKKLRPRGGKELCHPASQWLEQSGWVLSPPQAARYTDKGQSRTAVPFPQCPYQTGPAQ